MTTVRAITASVLMGVGIGLSAAPEIGGLVAVGFVLFVIGVVFAASVIVDVLGVE